MSNKQVNLKNRQFSNYEVQIANKYEKMFSTLGHQTKTN